jgi:hypothetical protein
MLAGRSTGLRTSGPSRRATRTSDFKEVYPRRCDSDSISRGLEDTLYLGRALIVGYARQHSDSPFSFYGMSPSSG